MKTRAALMALVAATAVAAPATARQGEDAASGSVIIEGLTLSGTQFGTPSGLPTTVPTDPLQTPVTEGDSFTYSTISCASPFPPFNNVGLQFDPDFPGIVDPASVRHELRGTVTKAKGERGKIRGTVTTFLCENGQRTDRIVTRYKASLQPTTATSFRFASGRSAETTGGLAFSGRFKVVDGTGRFEDLKARGRIVGQFTCLPMTLTRNSADSCVDLGAYSEVPFQERGGFRDPTT